MKPKHELIKDDIFQKILSGYYEVGSIIPTEVDLAESYGVSRPTVSQAIKTLVSKGFLERKQRKGTMVIRKKIDQEFTQTLSSFNNEMINKGVKPKTKILSFRKTEPSEEVREALRLKNHEMVYQLVRLRYADNNPLVVVTTYLPVQILPNLMEYNLESRSLYEVLREIGYSISFITRTLDIIKSDEMTSMLLGINKEDSLFYFKSTGRTLEGVHIEYSIARYRSDINTFKFEIEVND